MFSFYKVELKNVDYAFSLDLSFELNRVRP